MVGAVVWASAAEGPGSPPASNRAMGVPKRRCNAQSNLSVVAALNSKMVFVRIHGQQRLDCGNKALFGSIVESSSPDGFNAPALCVAGKREGENERSNF